MAVALAVMAPVALTAQAEQLPPEAQGLVVEMQQIQAQLAPVQQQALATAEIQQAQQELGGFLGQAMMEVAPESRANMERFAALRMEAQAAQAAEDQERLGSIAAEAQELDRRLQAAQRQAMQLPAVQAELEAFQTRLEQKMVEIDPAVAPLIERHREIRGELMEILGPPAAG